MCSAWNTLDFSVFARLINEGRFEEDARWRESQHSAKTQLILHVIKFSRIKIQLGL